MKKYKVLDHIENEQKDFNTFLECVEHIRENYISQDEGIHPEIEGIEIYQLAGTVKVIEPGKFNRLGYHTFDVGFTKHKNVWIDIKDSPVEKGIYYLFHTPNNKFPFACGYYNGLKYLSADDHTGIMNVRYFMNVDIKELQKL